MGFSSKNVGRTRSTFTGCVEQVSGDDIVPEQVQRYGVVQTDTVPKPDREKAAADPQWAQSPGHKFRPHLLAPAVTIGPSRSTAPYLRNGGIGVSDRQPGQAVVTL
ncbi:hypothetical protein [Mycolicibacter minnesotensis]|uniref:hypothetical protein n=1 Tax=Mycolicibacter minnesotensis TaxID=1118379 RepID=UPI0021F26582|nr:hypothetical protein [Mycolicibacter minnesotensis]